MAAILQTNEDMWISIKISLKFVPKGPIVNMSSLVQIMAWRWSGNKPLSEAMTVSLLTYMRHLALLSLRCDPLSKNAYYRRNFAEKKCLNFYFTVPADGLTLLDARQSAGQWWPNLGPIFYCLRLRQWPVTYLITLSDWTMSCQPWAPRACSQWSVSKVQINHSGLQNPL